MDTHVPRHYFVYAATVGTHLPGFYFALSKLARSSPGFWLMLSSLTVSTAFHWAERKHGLPGLYPLGPYSRTLLNMDRVSALVSSAFVAAHCVTWTPDNLIIGSIALTAMSLSELCFKDNWMWFGTWHSLWHLLAFRLLGNTLLAIERDSRLVWK